MQGERIITAQNFTKQAKISTQFIAEKLLGICIVAQELVLSFGLWQAVLF